MPHLLSCASALRYAQTHFPAFSSSHLDEICRLSSHLLLMSTIPSSSSLLLGGGGNSGSGGSGSGGAGSSARPADEIVPRLRTALRTFRSLAFHIMRMPSVSPLASLLRASEQAIPQIVQHRKFQRQASVLRGVQRPAASSSPNASSATAASTASSTNPTRSRASELLTRAVSQLPIHGAVPLLPRSTVVRGAESASALPLLSFPTLSRSTSPTTSTSTSTSTSNTAFRDLRDAFVSRDPLASRSPTVVLSSSPDATSAPSSSAEAASTAASTDATDATSAAAREFTAFREALIRAEEEARNWRPSPERARAARDALVNMRLDRVDGSLFTEDRRHYGRALMIAMATNTGLGPPPLEFVPSRFHHYIAAFGRHGLVPTSQALNALQHLPLTPDMLSAVLADPDPGPSHRDVLDPLPAQGSLLSRLMRAPERAGGSDASGASGAGGGESGRSSSVSGSGWRIDGNEDEEFRHPQQQAQQQSQQQQAQQQQPSDGQGERDEDLSALELDVDPSLVFHSCFVCPITRELCTADNPPMLLACGHLISSLAIDRIVSTSRAGRKVKCPTCPRETSPEKAVVVRL